MLFLTERLTGVFLLGSHPPESKKTPVSLSVKNNIRGQCSGFIIRPFLFPFNQSFKGTIKTPGRFFFIRHPECFKDLPYILIFLSYFFHYILSILPESRTLQAKHRRHQKNHKLFHSHSPLITR